MSLFHLNIVTPERQFFSEDVSKVIVRGVEGELAILKNKSPIITPLKMGIIKIYHEDKVLIAAIDDGYISVEDNYAIVVTKSAEWPYEIDLEEALEEKRKAEEALSRDHGVDVVQAQTALRRAINRIEVSELHKKIDQ
jgi:F-type H+-transporting ATPase subunit epsilon